MKEYYNNFIDTLLQSLIGYWNAFARGLPQFAFAVLVLLLTWFVASRISRFARGKLIRKAEDPLFGGFVANLIKYSLQACCVILFFHILGLTGIASGLLAGAGLSALIFGFAFKDIAENFLGGIILAFNRPFSLNDTVRIGEYVGHVSALNFRTTQIKTFDEKDVFIPNSRIVKEALVNLTKDGLIRLDFVVGIAYEDRINDALDLIVQVAETVEGVLFEKKPFTVVEEFGASTVNIRVFFWTKTDDYKKGVLVVKSTVMTLVKEKLLESGFTLPANIQELKLYDKAPSIPVDLISSTSKRN